jgi:hypothetical protein
MKSKIARSMLAVTALLASTQFVAAQGTSGGTGAVASIPGSVVRGHEQHANLVIPDLHERNHSRIAFRNA